jgi:TonB family protein
MNPRQKKISIIAISLLFHGIVLLTLLILYKSDNEWLFIDATQKEINVPETIFSEPQQSMPPLMQQEAWAELKPRASMFGDTQMHNDNAENSDVESHELSSDTLNDKTYQDTEKSEANYQENKISSHNAENFITINNELKSSKIQKSSKSSEKKLQAQKALASMTRGYLEQLKHEGENLIKTIGGDPNKMPSAEQLKYERYLAKIQWCLQNAHNINRDKCQMHEPIEAIMRVYFTLDRNGKMADLKIIQSSGDPFVDRYIHSLFEQASSSFPPMPAYIKEDPYQLLYTVMVCWNVANPTHMGFVRE